MIRTTTSSSSTLSPLAPPFTVDTYRYRYPLPPSTTPELNVNESFSGEEALPVRSVDMNSSWIDPSGHYNASPLSAGRMENFMAYADGYGTWRGNHSDSTAFQAKIGDKSSSFQASAEAGSSAFRAKTEADSSAWEDNQKIYDKKKTDPVDSEYSYFQFPDPNLVVQECPTSNSKSSYDRYISQLVTSSSDSFACYPPENCLSSAHICRPDNITGSSTSTYYVQKNAYQSTGHGTLFYDVDDNYLDYMLLNKTQPASNQYIGYKGDYVKGYMADGKNKGTNGIESPSVAIVCSSSGDEITTDARHNFAAKQVDFSESVSSSVTSSAEYSDQANQTEDSPCWKGASKFRECPFNRVNDVDHYDEVKESENSVGLIQGQKCIAGSQCMKTSLEISFSGIDKTEGSKCAEVASVIPNKSTERKDLMRGSEAEDILMLQSIHERTATLSTNGPMLPESSRNKLFNPNLEADQVRNFTFSGAILDQVSNPIDTTVPSTTCAKGRKDVIHLVKAMHNISEALLLSSVDSDVNWEESHHELIKLVIANLESFACRNKKDTALHTYAEKSFNTSRSRGPSQEVSVEDLESDVFSNKESNPQVLVYKNLWMQAEAALCSLKYELQLTHMKDEMQNLSCEKKGINPVQTMKSPMQNLPQLFDMLKHTTPPLTCIDALPVQNDAVSSNETKPKEQRSNMEETAESSIMARLEILRGRYAHSNDNSNTEQTKHLATETMFNDFADLGFVESRAPHQLDGDGNKDVNMAPGTFVHKFYNELDVYL